MNWFERAQNHLTSQRPFALFCKPNSSKIIGVFQKSNELFTINDFTESGFVFASFDGKQKIVLPSHECDVIVDTWLETDFHLSKNEPIAYNLDAKIAFEALVGKGVQAIQKGDFRKVVLSRKEMVATTTAPIAVFKSLLFHYKTAFNYCFYHPQIGLWLGATPEQLIKIEDTTLHTVALAGTQLFDDELVWEAKEKEEQRLVTEFITESLRLFSAEVTISEPTTIQAGNLAHIKTAITAIIHKADLAAILQKLHPTPAVCGMPKAPAMEFIRKNENYEREFYTGFLGELNIDFTTFQKSNSDLFVNLRCMKLADHQATIYVGCGVTKDSHPEKEFVETVNKSMTVKRSLL